MPPTRLRPYQAEPARAILASVRQGLGLTFAVEMSRQAGKNELSAWLETALMTRAARHGGSGLKAAPTFTPQAQYSIDRLAASLTAAGYGPWQRLIEGRTLRLLNATWTFYSAEPTANVVGATASLLLEVDEAQDVAPDKFNKDFRPMGAAHNVTTVLYGTAWEETGLLEETLAANRQAERRDGLRRNFVYPWHHCARYSPAYARYVAAERARLGPDHPLFTTQYDLKPLPGGGRLLKPADLDLIRGAHPRLPGAAPGATYVAGLDIAGEAPRDIAAARGQDYTALAVGQVTWPAAADLPHLAITALYAWQGAAHDPLYTQIAHLLAGVWAVRRVAVDSTAMGEAAAIMLRRALGPTRVIPYRYTQQTKSSLGYGLQAAAATGRLQVHADDGTAEYRQMWEQLRLCRATYTPNRLVAWDVDPAHGHDDLLNALALATHAATDLRPATARGRPHA